MNNKVKNAIIIILAVLVLGLSGYLVYEKMLSNDNNVEEENKQESKEESYDLVKAMELIDDYYYFGLNGSSFSAGYTEDAKMYLANVNVAQKDISKIYCNDVYNNKSNVNNMHQYQVHLDDNLTGFCQVDFSTKIISYESFSNAYKELFGKDKQLPKKDFKFGATIYDYDGERNSFVELTCNCGGIAPFATEIYGVKSAKIINDNKLIVDVGRIEVSWNDNFEGTVVIDILGQNLNYNLSEVNSPVFKRQFLNQYLDKLDTYKFTFFEENGVYKLESMVKGGN